MRQLRVLALAPSLVLAALLIVGCASAPSRPPAPISSGEPRAEPQPPLPGGERSEGEIEMGELGELEPGEGRRELTPPHMTGRDITRAAILLPFSHPNPSVRAEAQGLLAGIEMALFERAGDSFLILPKDTAGTTAGARKAFDEALEDGADLVLGPLFSDNVRTISSPAREGGLPVIAFSNDPAAAGGGAYLASFSVEEEVARVVDHAVSQGVDTFAFLGPRNTYGMRVERALRFEAVRQGAFVIAGQFYDPANDTPVDEAGRLAQTLEPVVAEKPGQVAVMIPESGVRLRGVAPLLPYSGLDFRKIRMLGTSQWNDPSLWREPTLNGAWFAVPPPADREQFETSFARIYGRNPSSLASLGYEAAAVAISLNGLDRLDAAGLTDTDGFIGVNGLFRFRIDGTIERGLAVMEIDTAEGAQLVSPAPSSFDPPVG